MPCNQVFQAPASLLLHTFSLLIDISSIPFQNLKRKSVGSSIYLTYYWEEKDGDYNFPKGICPKVNVIVRLEFELAYYDSAVQRFIHYATRTPRNNAWPLLNCRVHDYKQIGSWYDFLSSGHFEFLKSSPS